MISENELRIGNWVECNGIRFQITGTHLSAMQVDPSTKEIFPISLTPEILEKCGFKKVGDDRWSNETLCRSIYRSKKSGGFDFEDDYGRGICDIDFFYVHQLQNLYFALTGTELEIKITDAKKGD